MTSRITILLSVCCIAAVLVTATSVKAVVDDFNTGTPSAQLSGRVAPSGQTWADFDYWSGPAALTLETAHGAGGTLGAGAAGEGGNSIGLTSPQNAIQTVKMSLDWTVDALDADRPRNPQFWLVDTVNGTSMSAQWASDQASEVGTGDIAFEFSTSLKNGDFTNKRLSTGMDTDAGTLHLELEWDLFDRTMKMSWYDVDDPGDLSTSGSTLVATDPWDSTWIPDRLHMFVNGNYCCFPSGRNFAGVAGYDNISIELIEVVPEPATIGLLALGGLAMLRRRRAA